MFFAGLAFAWAGEPTRCVATWTADTPACALRGEFAGMGAAPSLDAAERSARKHLATVLERSQAAMRAVNPNIVSAQFMMCQEKATEFAHVNCFAEPSLVGPTYCFAELADRECWDGEVLAVGGPAWRALDLGRRELCEKVDARLVQLNYSDMGVRRVTCAASCEATAMVRCPK